jgi:eukaryotic translation initiation factor 2C
MDKNGQPQGTPRSIKKLTLQGASELSFELREGGRKTVAQYFNEIQGAPLKYPHVICAEVSCL